MPNCETRQDKTNDPRNDAKQHVVDRHKTFHIFGVTKDFAPEPRRGHRKADPTVYRCVDQEQKEGLVVPQSHACGQPGAMMIHFEHAAPTSRAVMRAVRLPSFTFLAKPGLARRFHGERWSVAMRRRLVGGKVRIARFAARFEGRTWIREDGSSV